MIESRLLIANGIVLGEHGDTFMGGKTIVCKDGAIEEVVATEDLVASPVDNVVDVGGSYVLPGLIDAHFHLVSRSGVEADEDVVSIGMLEGVLNAEERLQAGVTTVRDAGCRHRGIFPLAAAIEAGLLRGPRVFAAGRNPTGKLAPSHWRNVVVSGEQEMRSAVSSQLDIGASWIKCVIAHADDPTEWNTVTQYVSEDELRAAVSVAHERGALVSVHCEGYEQAAMAVRCGVDALEHAPLIDEETAQSMARQGTIYVPTIWAFSDDSGIDLAALTPGQRQRILYWRSQHLESVARAYAYGVRIAAGSDAVGTTPDRDVLVRELVALSGAGLNGSDLVKAATYVGGMLVGQGKRLGRISAGAYADMVVVGANPHTDIDTLRSPEFVISRGEVVVDNSSARGERKLDRAAAVFSSSVERWV